MVRAWQRTLNCTLLKALLTTTSESRVFRPSLVLDVHDSCHTSQYDGFQSVEQEILANNQDSLISTVLRFDGFVQL